MAVIAAEPVEQEMPVHLCQAPLVSPARPRTARPPYLRLDQHQVDEQDDEIVLDVFVREALAARALREAHALAQRAVVGFAVRRVEASDGIAAGDADGHGGRAEVAAGAGVVV